MRVIGGDEVDRVASWPLIIAALKAGHRLPKPQIGDVYLTGGGNGLLSRTAWIDGLGCCVKAATVFPGNVDHKPPLASIHGAVLLFNRETGVTRAVVDGAAVTRWKTAADSALGSELLSRPDARVLLMAGAGAMSGPLVRAHLSVRPGIERVVIWNRSRARAEALAMTLADLGKTVEVTSDLEQAVRGADIISAATMSSEPLLRGAWLKPGTHLDLVGAYTPQMREADDEAIRRARVFVDFRETTVGHIGELMIPIRNGVIREEDVLGDLYDLCGGAPGRNSPADITFYKNGGGGHLDLMTVSAIVDAAARSA